MLFRSEEEHKKGAEPDTSQVDEELTPLPPPVSLMDDAALADAKKMLTRIKPPADALSIEDRLFYLLQPPLQRLPLEMPKDMQIQPIQLLPGCC